MAITHEDIQRAKRISRAIQEYLEQNNADGLRSTDVYPILAQKGLIEKDRHNGIHFRSFLKKLKNDNLLSLIPQCQYRTTRTDFLEWYFYRVKDCQKRITLDEDEERTIIIPPMISKEDTYSMLELLKPLVTEFPKNDTSSLTPQTIEIRNSYPRAYEIWTKEEMDLMKTAYKILQNVDKVAELLQRQPHIVARKLNLNF